jgi:hypothetical protein
MQITQGQCVLIDGEIVGALRLLPDGRLQVLAIDRLHEVTKLATIDDENKAVAALRHHRSSALTARRV